MRRSIFLRRHFGKFIAALTLVGLIVYTLYHALGSASGSLITAPARRVTDTQILGGEACLFRSETVIGAEQSGLVNDLVPSGGKVGKDVTLAEVWTNESGLSLQEAQKLLDRVNRMLNIVENSKVGVGEPLSNAQQYKNQANADYLAIKEAIATGDMDGVADLEDDMLTYLGRYSVLTGTEQTLADVQLSLELAKAGLLGGTHTDVVNTVLSGYFYNRSYVDGGETIFTDEMLENITPESLDVLRSQFGTATPPAFSVGKMVYDYDWHIAINFDASVSEILTVGANYRVTFPENADRVFPMTCDRITAGADGRVTVVLTASDNPEDFEYLRMQRVEIEVGECRGYYVPEQALHTVRGADGTDFEGVYVFENSTVYFKLIKVIYRGDGYVIVSEQGDLGSAYLALNDIVVISGSNLYDGKVLK